MRDFIECKTYVGHLRSAHKQIHQLVSDIEGEVSLIKSPKDQARMCESLRRLRDTLDGHFKEEEEGGCMEEAVSRLPRLSQEVAEIEKEHADILDMMDRLIERARESSAVDFHDSFEEFAVFLHTHEAAENRILQTAFGTGEFENDDSPSAYGE